MKPSVKSLMRPLMPSTLILSGAGVLLLAGTVSVHAAELVWVAGDTSTYYGTSPGAGAYPGTVPSLPAGTTVWQRDVTPWYNNSGGGYRPSQFDMSSVIFDSSAAAGNTYSIDEDTAKGWITTGDAWFRYGGGSGTTGDPYYGFEFLGNQTSEETWNTTTDADVTFTLDPGVVVRNQRGFTSATGGTSRLTLTGDGLWLQTANTGSPSSANYDKDYLTLSGGATWKQTGGVMKFNGRTGDTTGVTIDDGAMLWLNSTNADAINGTNVLVKTGGTLRVDNTGGAAGKQISNSSSVTLEAGARLELYGLEPVRWGVPLNGETPNPGGDAIFRITGGYTLATYSAEGVNNQWLDYNQGLVVGEGSTFEINYTGGPTAALVWLQIEHGGAITGPGFIYVRDADTSGNVVSLGSGSSVSGHVAINGSTAQTIYVDPVNPSGTDARATWTGELDLRNSDKTFSVANSSDSTDFEFSGHLSVSGVATMTLTKTGAGTMSFEPATFSSSGLNDQGLDFVVNQGTLILDASAAGAKAGTSYVNAGTLLLHGSPGTKDVFLGATSGSQAAAVNLVDGLDITTPLTVRAGSSGNKRLNVVNTAAADDTTWSGDITLDHRLIIVTNGENNTLRLTGAITGPNGLTKLDSGGAGTLVLGGTAPNTYQGNNYIYHGVVRLEKDHALGTSGAQVYFGTKNSNSQVVLELADGVELDRDVRVRRDPNDVAERIFVGGDGSLFSGEIELEDKDLQFRVEAGDAATVSGGMVGTGGLHVNDHLGTGTLVLEGANTYGGTTTVYAGTLLQNGTHSGGGTYAVHSGATLGGGGDIRPSSVELHGAVSPGASVGTFHSGDETWHDGASFLLEMNDAEGEAGGGITGLGWDLLVIDDTLDLTALCSGGFTVNLTGTADNFENLATYQWEFVRTTQGVVGFQAGDFTVNATLTNPLTNISRFEVLLQGNSVGGESLFLLYAVPEPSTLALAAVGLLGLALLGRRRRS